MNPLYKKAIYRSIALLAYATCGILLFHFVEKKPERNKDIASRLSQELHQKLLNQYNISMNVSEFNRFTEDAYNVVRTKNKSEWTIIGCAAFIMSTLTTIGYGQVTPDTPLGQILTMLYCIPGLPLMMLTLKTLGEIISRLVYKMVTKVETKILHRQSPRCVKIKSFVVMVLLTKILFCVGAVVQVILEDWSFVEGFYTYFVTFSTIGYGDYIPTWSMLKHIDDSPQTTATIFAIMLAVTLPSLGGLCLVSGILNSLVESADEFRIRVRSFGCNFKSSAHNTKNFELANTDENHYRADELSEKVPVLPSKRRGRSASV